MIDIFGKARYSDEGISEDQKKVIEQEILVKQEAETQTMPIVQPLLIQKRESQNSENFQEMSMEEFEEEKTEQVTLA